MTRKAKFELWVVAIAAACVALGAAAGRYEDMSAERTECRRTA